MKKVVLVLFAVAGFTGVKAQNVSFGPIAGFNHSWITGTSQSDREFNAGFTVGARLTYSIDPHWAIGADAVFSNEGFRAKNMISQTQFTNNTDLNYIRIPLKATYFFGELGDKLRPKLYLGPSLGFLVGGKTELETRNMTTGATINTKTNSRDNYKSFDAGAIIGTGFNYRIGSSTWLNFDLSYTNGFMDISKSVSTWNSNRNFGVGLGVTFPIGTITQEK